VISGVEAEPNVAPHWPALSHPAQMTRLGEQPEAQALDRCVALERLEEDSGWHFRPCPRKGCRCNC
jgi:hypothetical protein